MWGTAPAVSTLASLCSALCDVFPGSTTRNVSWEPIACVDGSLGVYLDLSSSALDLAGFDVVVVSRGFGKIVADRTTQYLSDLAWDVIAKCYEGRKDDRPSRPSP